MFLALSFVPANDVIIAFNILSTNEFIISEILILVELTRIQQENHFFLLICGIHMNLPGLCQTNNNFEGWYNSFSKIVNCAHPSLWRVIKFLQIDEKYHLLQFSN
ncbi:LOW QUALITY PROTEIN: hypothetical protein HZS_5354 [Henneguya salminicola]|nr:LOW QUALITY PROTEIN: hypothetical protein HZS_5354 [Henneguya salminicola]